MDQFTIANELKNLIGMYPAASDIATAGKNGGHQARWALARLWLSEGIPWAFKERPALYESMRSWLGTMIDADPKEIGLTGSARLGSSLSPKKLGNPFSDTSDLDLFIVSEKIFDVLREEFTNWSLSFESGDITPNNDRELGFWRDNNKRGSITIQKGFLDQKMIPNRPSFPLTRKLAQTMWLLTEKLKKTPDAPHPAKASIRCYSSWQAFVQQMALNLQ